MKIRNIYKIGVVFSLMSVFSCTEDLVEMNKNPNGADPGTTNPNMVLSTVLTETARAFVTLGYGDMAGVVQHTQKDGWAGGHNSYEWGGSNDWSGYYGILRNNKFVYDKAVELNQPLQQGVSLVMKAMVFGLIADLFGDAPYTDALKGATAGAEYTYPKFDSQQVIYEGVLADLEEANKLLSATSFNSTMGSSDVFFAGNVTKWRKFANSLALRYYMRLAEKSPAVAKAGIEKIVATPATYPIITASADDVAMSFIGNSNADSWPSNATYDTDSTNYRRIKMANTFVRALLARNDPRMGVWANKVAIFLQVQPGAKGVDRVADTIVNGERRRVRYLSPDKLMPGTTIADVNQDPNYVGLPLRLSTPYAYNQNAGGVQSSRNPHVSWVNTKFSDAKSGIKARIMSAAEVRFILAEASAHYKWNAGDAKEHYNQGILASFTAWGLNAAAATAYAAQPSVAFDGTQSQIITQKWIASWSVATEAWFDWRRTGYPVLEGASTAGVLPVRLYYELRERNQNSANTTAAAAKLEKTGYSQYGDAGLENSAWSKPWVLQGTGKPWK